MDEVVAVGWNVEDRDTDVAYPSSDRNTFRDVLLRDDLRTALGRINLARSQPWLNDARVGQAASALERAASPHIMEANQEATHLLQLLRHFILLKDDQGHTIKMLACYQQFRAMPISHRGFLHL